MNEQAEAAVNKGKEKLMAGYAKGNEMMDKVSFLKKPLHKKIAWGVIVVVVLLLIKACLFGQDIESDTLKLFHEHGANGVTKVELKEVSDGKYEGWVYAENGNRFGVTVFRRGRQIEATGEAVAVFRIEQAAAALGE